jgi:hypothetical protein
LRAHQRDEDPRDVRLAQLVGDRSETDRCQLADEQVRAEHERRSQQQVLRPDPAQRHRFGHDLSSCGGGGFAQLLQVDLVRMRQVAEVRRERCSLEVRERTPDGLATSGVGRLPQRSFGAHEDGARDEQLGHVDVERRLWRTERCRGPVDQHRRRPAGGRDRGGVRDGPGTEPAALDQGLPADVRLPLVAAVAAPAPRLPRLPPARHLRRLDEARGRAQRLLRALPRLRAGHQRAPVAEERDAGGPRLRRRVEPALRGGRPPAPAVFSPPPDY